MSPTPETIDAQTAGTLDNQPITDAQSAETLDQPITGEQDESDRPISVQITQRDRLLQRPRSSKTSLSTGGRPGSGVRPGSSRLHDRLETAALENGDKMTRIDDGGAY